MSQEEIQRLLLIYPTLLARALWLFSERADVPIQGDVHLIFGLAIGANRMRRLENGLED